MLVIGAKDAEELTVAVRDRSKGDLGSMTFDGFMEHLKNEFNPL